MILLVVLSALGQVGFPAQRLCRCSRVLVVGARGSWLGDGESGEAVMRAGDCVGPGPVRVDVQDTASGGVHETAGHGEDPQPESFRLVGAGRDREGEAGAPGQQVLGQRGDGDPDPVLVDTVEGQVGQAGVLRRADAVLDAGMSAVA